MRVQGNEYPELVVVEDYLSKQGMSEIRLRENVQEVTVTDPETGTAVTIYEYDEYKTLVATKPGLKETIAANLSEWIITLRGLEVNESASIFCKVKDENAVLLNDMAQMIDEVYQSDMEMMGL